MPKKTPPIDPTDPTIFPMNAREQHVFDACQAAFPVPMQTVVAARCTLSGHWQVLYTDGHWSLLVNMGGYPMGVGGLTHLGHDDTLSQILEAD